MEEESLSKVADDDCSSSMDKVEEDLEGEGEEEDLKQHNLTYKQRRLLKKKKKRKERRQQLAMTREEDSVTDSASFSSLTEKAEEFAKAEAQLEAIEEEQQKKKHDEEQRAWEERERLAQLEFMRKRELIEKEVRPRRL